MYAVVAPCMQSFFLFDSELAGNFQSSAIAATMMPVPPMTSAITQRWFAISRSAFSLSRSAARSAFSLSRSVARSAFSLSRIAFSLSRLAISTLSRSKAAFMRSIAVSYSACFVFTFSSSTARRQFTDLRLNLLDLLPQFFIRFFKIMHCLDCIRLLKSFS